MPEVDEEDVRPDDSRPDDGGEDTGPLHNPVEESLDVFPHVNYPFGASMSETTVATRTTSSVHLKTSAHGS